MKPAIGTIYLFNGGYHLLIYTSLLLQMNPAIKKIILYNILYKLFD